MERVLSHGACDIASSLLGGLFFVVAGLYMFASVVSSVKVSGITTAPGYSLNLLTMSTAHHHVSLSYPPPPPPSF